MLYAVLIAILLACLPLNCDRGQVMFSLKQSASGWVMTPMLPVELAVNIESGKPKAGIVRCQQSNEQIVVTTDNHEVTTVNKGVLDCEGVRFSVAELRFGH